MLCWCKLCRKWVDQYHFLQKSGGWEGCGQERDDIRYHPSSPLCGDVWKLTDSRHLLVDYIDPFNVGVTFSDGTRAGVRYRDSFKRHVEGGELISTFEEWPYRYCDYRGWSKDEDKDKATLQYSLAFLKNVIAMKTVSV